MIAGFEIFPGCLVSLLFLFEKPSVNSHEFHQRDLSSFSKLQSPVLRLYRPHGWRLVRVSYLGLPRKKKSYDKV